MLNLVHRKPVDNAALTASDMAILPPLVCYTMNAILHIITIFTLTIIMRKMNLSDRRQCGSRKKQNPSLSYTKCFHRLVKKVVIDTIYDKFTVRQNLALKAILSLAFVESTTGVSTLGCFSKDTLKKNKMSTPPHNWVLRIECLKKWKWMTVECGRSRGKWIKYI